MIKLRSRKAKIAAISGAVILFFCFVFFLLRGPYLSNSIKRLLIPMFENATRERILIEKAVINLFPFYVQVKRFKVFDNDGNRLLWVRKSRIYIDLLALLSNEIRVRKLTLVTPILTAEEGDIKRILGNISKTASSDGEGGYSVSLKNIKLTDGRLDYKSGDGKYHVAWNGLNLDMTSKRETSRIVARLSKGQIILPNQSSLEGVIDGDISFNKKEVKVSALNIKSDKSYFSTRGEVAIEGERKISHGSFDISSSVEVSKLNDVLNLKSNKEGALTVEGKVKLLSGDKSYWPDVELDLNTESTFYLETLMDILEVDETVKGKLKVRGHISGKYPDITATGQGRLESAVIDTLPINRITADVAYRDSSFLFNNAIASIYGGKLQGSASILIPSGDYFVKSDVEDIYSADLFNYIGWDSPLPPGKVSGSIDLSCEGQGCDIDLSSFLSYKNTSSQEGDYISRVRDASTSLVLRGSKLWLKDTVLSTSKTRLYLDGIIDVNEEHVELKAAVESEDITDLTKPYYSAIKSSGSFDGIVKGSLTDPLIAGRLNIGPGYLRSIRIDSADADISYKRNLLAIDNMEVTGSDGRVSATGSVIFEDAEELFDFSSPFFDANARLDSIDIHPLIKDTYRDVPVYGRTSGTVKFKGDLKEFKSDGDLRFIKSELYGQPVDSLTMSYVLTPKQVEIEYMNAVRAGSVVEGKGVLGFNNNIDLTIASEKLQLCDFPLFNGFLFDAEMSLGLKAKGMLENPHVDYTIMVRDSLLGGMQVGKGHVEGIVRNREMKASGELADGLVSFNSMVHFGEKIGWTVDSVLNKGHYEFLLPVLIGDVPEDTRVFLDGRINVEGQDELYSARSIIKSADIELYGYDFSNSEQIDIDYIDGEVLIRPMTLNGSNGNLFISGRHRPGETYDYEINGNLMLGPMINLFSENISSLKGGSTFNLSIAGSHNESDITGEINIEDTTSAIAGFPYIIGPVNGRIILEKNRIVFDELKSKFAGGSVSIAGNGEMDMLSLTRLFVAADFSEVRVRPVEGLNATLDGKLLYDKSERGSNLTGNINIRKARYSKRVEWKSWILGLQDIQGDDVNYPAFLADTVTNIHVAGDENILIDNNIARTPVKISLNLTGTVSKRGLLGRVEANEGTVYFRRNEFNILEGSSVDFVASDSISPVFHIIADTYVGDYYVKLSMDGTMENFSLSLFSDPPLTEADILALLTIGQTTKEAKGIESGIAAGEATAILTGGIQDTVEEQFQYVTGLERFELEPHTTTEGAFVPRVTVGKRLFEDKLFVTYSTAIGTAEDDVVKLEYKLDKNISVIGSRNEIGSAGVDLKYRFEFK